ncbi:MAG: spore coat protein [Ruminococcaceae bacterium]|nr:spore coat protein [Oscillospiraceae bacterium]
MEFLFSEREILNQVMQDEKIILVKCSEILGESSCQELRRMVTEIMTESQQLQFEFHNAMKNRGWLSRDVANNDKIQSLVRQMNSIKERI